MRCSWLAIETIVPVLLFGTILPFGNLAHAQGLPELPPASLEPTVDALDNAEPVDEAESADEVEPVDETDTLKDVEAEDVEATDNTDVADEAQPEAPPANAPESVLDLPQVEGAVELGLPELLNIVIQGNRDLKNSVLDRIVQRQSLRESESVFSPQVTPNLSLRAERNVSDSSPFAIAFGETTEGNDDVSFSESVEIGSTLRTPLGTELSLSVEPTEDLARANLLVSQPLLRGAGQAVNRAPVRQARIAESNNVLALQQQVIDTITTGINQYTALVQSQEAVKIQAQALERRREQFEQLRALVEAGRRARIDLIDSERSIAVAELDLQDARNQLSQANTDLLNLMGSEAAYQFVVPEDAIARLFEAATRRVSAFQQAELIELAYERRTDYQQALAQVEVEDLNLLLARDNRRWDLNWESVVSVGDDLTQAATGLTLRRTFGDESLETAVVRSETNVVQQQNTIDQLTETIRNEVSDRLRDVTSGLAQVEAAQRATEAAQLQLQVTREKFRRGRDGITPFEISEQEDNLVAAQNAELQQRISAINSIAELEQTLGITLEVWEPVVDFNSVLSDS